MMNQDIRFQSQRGKPCPESGCGVACASMLLQHAGVHPRPSYHALMRALRLQAAGPRGEPAPGIYPADVSKFLRVRRIPFQEIGNEDARGLRRVLAALRAAPVMALVRGTEWGGEDHWIVLIGAERGRLVYLDPWYRATQRYRRRMTFPAFSTMWRDAAFCLRRHGTTRRLPDED